MAKFKVGDRVIRTYPSWRDVVSGKTYTVKSCSDSELTLLEGNEEYTPYKFDLAPSDLPTDRPLTYDETQRLKKGDVVFTCTERIIKSINEKEIRFTNSERNVWILDPENKKTKGNLFFVSHGKEESKEEKKEEVKADKTAQEAYGVDFADIYTIAETKIKEKPVLKSVSQILYGRR